jgi:hypothetical protein
LTSLQHENFDRNLNNFKELDVYINGILSFDKFINLKNESSPTKTKTTTMIKDNFIELKENYSPPRPTSIENNKSDIDLNEIKEFAKTFGKRRQLLGLSETQIVKILSQYSNSSIFNEKSISRFEMLDITPKSGSKLKPALERLLTDSELKFGNRLGTNLQNINNNDNQQQQQNRSQQPLATCLSYDTAENKKRKRPTLFTAKIVDSLNEFYAKKKKPTGTFLLNFLKIV